MVNTRSSRRKTLGPIPTNRRVTMADDHFDTVKPSSSTAITTSTTTTTRSSRQRMSMIPRVSSSSSSSITPAKSNSKRTSTRGHKSMGGAIASPYNPHNPHNPHTRQSNIPAPTIMKTDTRPISDKTYFNKCVKNLHSYLERNQYEHPIKLKDLTRPSGKDFHNIMLFLLSKIDESFYGLHYNSKSNGMDKGSHHGSSNSNNNNSNAPPKRKFEDDVAMMFKTLGYPFNISKTALVAAGSPHTWPSLLLAITWLIELLNSMSEEYLYEDDLIYKNLLEEEHYGNSNNRNNINSMTETNIFHGISESGTKPLINNQTIMDDVIEIEQKGKVATQIFIERSYESFLTGDDELYESMENQLLEYLEKDHMLIEQAYERFCDENGDILVRVKSIEEEFESLPANENRLEDLAQHLETFQHLKNQMNEHKNTLSDKVNKRISELQIKESELESMKQRIQSLLETIATQEYSVEDVYKLEREKVQLEERLGLVLKKREEEEDLTLEKEKVLKRELERLDRFVEPYNDSVKELDMNMMMKDESSSSLVKIISVVKNMAHEKDQMLLLGNVDLKNKIVPTLQEMEQEYNDETTKLRSQMYALKEEQTKMEEEVDDRKEKVEVITDSIKRAEDIYQREKEEKETALSTRQKEVEALEEKVETLRDPSAVETVMSKYQSQIKDLESLCKKHQEGNLARKQAVLSKFNHALRVCSEYKMHIEKELNSLDKYLNGRQEFDITLNEDEKNLLSK